MCLGLNKKRCGRNNLDIVSCSFSHGYLSDSEWANLPHPVVFCILDKLWKLIDHIRFAAVCKLWHSNAKDYHLANPRSLKALPMLLIPNECQEKSSLTNRKFVYSVSQGKLCSNKIQLRVPYSKRCCGSSYGWLATIDIPTPIDQGLIIALRNPFRKAWPIRLPPLNVKIREGSTSNYERYVPKVILSADPTLNPDNYVVIAVYGSEYNLAFIKRGQKNWTYVDRSSNFIFTDVIFYKNQIYATGIRGEIVSWDINTSNNPSQPPKAKLLKPHKPPLLYGELHSYLVESTKGDLLRIRRLYRLTEEKMKTRDFMVYKLVFNNEDESIVEEVEVTSIGDDALFLGDNHSVSVLASNFPGCQSNSIYYTDDMLLFGNLPVYDRPWDDMGIFNLEDKTITHHYSSNPTWQRYIPPAIWVEPTLFTTFLDFSGRPSNSQSTY